MLTVYNTPLDFDITCPEDILRYNKAVAKMSEQKTIADKKEQGKNEADGDIKEYAEYLRQECDVVINFIDDVFGEGTCNKLMGEKSSLSALIDLCDEITVAVKNSTKEAEKKLAKYEPNRNVSTDGKSNKAAKRTKK